MERQSDTFPRAEVELQGDDSFTVSVRELETHKLLDQGSDVQTDAGQGCISTPDGPRC